MGYVLRAVNSRATSPPPHFFYCEIGFPTRSIIAQSVRVDSHTTNLWTAVLVTLWEELGLLPQDAELEDQLLLPS